MPEPLSKIERRILNYLADYLRRNTYQPSIREIGKRFAIKSTKTVSEHLQALADKGYVERDASRSRGVRILGMDLSPEVMSIPCYGRVAAGTPILMRDDIEEEFTVDRKLAPSADTFFLRVVGDSMNGVGILAGDLVLVEPVDDDEAIQDGEIVAARLGGEAAVKRFFNRGGEIVLEPANPDFAPMLVRDEPDFVVMGRVSGLVRRSIGIRAETRDD